MVYTLSMLLARPFIDRLMDRKGVIVPGAATTALALLVLSRSTSLTGFLISALDYAAGQGELQSGSQAMAVLAAPQDRAGAASATYFTGFDAGIGFGAVAAEAVAASIGYADTFLVLSVLPLLGLACLGKKRFFFLS